MPSNEEIIVQRTKGKSESTVAFNPLIGLRAEDLLEVLERIATKNARRPTLSLKHSVKHLGKLLAIARSKKTYEPNPKDKRFADPAWNESAFFKTLLQSYLALIESLSEWESSLELSATDKKKSEFILRLLGDSISPNNFLLTNPAAIKKAKETQGASLMSGAANLLNDIRNDHGIPAQVKPDSFIVGEDLACTPGKVVFRNEVLELIQYQPSTSKVYRRPFLMVGAMINKFYVADLAPGRSFIEYATGCGFQVFTVSWANPQKEQADWGIEKYALAISEALEAIKSITKCKDINVFGGCSGGIVVSSLAAYLTSKEEKIINSLTLMGCVLDWRDEDSELGAFANEKTYRRIKQRSKKAGVLKGYQLALSSILLRPREMIWDNVVNNYLMGDEPPEFDLLHWNNDRTNLAAQLHCDLIDISKDSSLMQPGSWKLDQVPLNLSDIKCDMFIIAGSSDHMTPWPACYRTMSAFSGRKTFVLSNSGHMQTMLNSPKKRNASFFINDVIKEDSRRWLSGAELQEGSWYEYWRDWIAQRSLGQKASPKVLGNSKYAPMVDAPGEYVFQEAS